MFRTFVCESLCGSPQEQLTQLNTKPFRTGDWFDSINEKLHYHVTPLISVQLEIRELRDIGLRHGGTWSELRKALRGQDLSYVPLELIVPLRLAYTNQPQGEFVRLASPPVHGPDDRRLRFSFHNDGTSLWLRARENNEPKEDLWPAHFLFAFLRRH